MITRDEMQTLLAFQSPARAHSRYDGIHVAENGRLCCTDGVSAAVVGTGSAVLSLHQCRRVSSADLEAALAGLAPTDILDFKLAGDYVEIHASGPAGAAIVRRAPAQPGDTAVWRVVDLEYTPKAEPISFDVTLLVRLVAVTKARNAYAKRLRTEDIRARKAAGLLGKAEPEPEKWEPRSAWTWSFGGELDPVVATYEPPYGPPWRVVVMPVRM